MASKHKVSCINKTNRYDPHERISHIGGYNDDYTRWRITQQEAIYGIETGKWQFFVTKNTHAVNVIVAISRYGNKYIKTEADDDQPDNLLSLPNAINSTRNVINFRRLKHVLIFFVSDRGHHSTRL